MGCKLPVRSDNYCMISKIQLECLHKRRGYKPLIFRLETNDACFVRCSPQTKERFEPGQEEPLSKEMWSIGQDLLRLKSAKQGRSI